MCLLTIASAAHSNSAGQSFSSLVSLKRATSSGKIVQVHKDPVVIRVFKYNKNFLSEMFNVKFIIFYFQNTRRIYINTQ